MWLVDCVDLKMIQSNSFGTMKKSNQDKSFKSGGDGTEVAFAQRILGSIFGISEIFQSKNSISLRFIDSCTA